MRQSVAIASILPVCYLLIENLLILLSIRSGNSTAPPAQLLQKGGHGNWLLWRGDTEQAMDSSG